MNRHFLLTLLIFTFFCSASSYKRNPENEGVDLEFKPIEKVNLFEADPLEIKLNFESQNKVYVVPLNKKIAIKMRGNITTGYEWVVDEVSEKNKMYEILSKDYQTDQHEEGLAGVGGEYTFVVIMKEEGNHHLNFLYKRSWETEPISFISANFEAVKEVKNEYKRKGGYEHLEPLDEN
mmetsp:Transcript_19610/g.20408  ORF Transcript_19610/g.20408 Transcript_19610/m.20408 type:complete len:178 (-) Transcript_19610:129-662(-)